MRLFLLPGNPESITEAAGEAVLARTSSWQFLGKVLFLPRPEPRTDRSGDM